MSGNWILTHTGNHFDFADPKPEQISLLDIAVSLGRTARFRGHTSTFYSVAQHSIIVARLVGKSAPHLSVEGLMHDAAEAYMSDVPTPLKQMLPDYRFIERKVDAAIRERFGLQPTMLQIVKDADHEALLIERACLLPDDSQWPIIHINEHESSMIDYAMTDTEAAINFLKLATFYGLK